MKRLLTVLLLFISLGAVAQTYDTLPTGSKPYGNFYLGPDGNLVFGNSGLKFRVIGTKKRVDSLLALKADASALNNYILKTGGSGTNTNLTTPTLTGAVNVATTPGNSFANFDFLTRDQTTGEVKKITSAVIPDLSPYQLKSEKGNANGYASLDAGGKVPLTQINDALIGSVNYRGTYNGTTNTPALPTVAAANKGWYYVYTDSGIRAGKKYYQGDWIISSGSVWDVLNQSNRVTSVNGMVGGVQINDITGNAGSATRWGGTSASLFTLTGVVNGLLVKDHDDVVKIANDNQLKTYLGIPSSGETLQSVTDRSNITTNFLSSYSNSLDNRVSLDSYGLQATNAANNSPKDLSLQRFGGNVGVGTSNVESSLSIAGSISQNPVVEGVHLGKDQGGYSAIQLNGATGSYIDFSAPGSDYQGRILYDNASNLMRFGTANATDKMNLNANGDLSVLGTVYANNLISNSAVLGAENNFRLEFSGDAANSDIRFYRGGSGSWTVGSAVGIAPAATNPQMYFNWFDGIEWATKFRIDPSGDTFTSGNVAVQGNIYANADIASFGGDLKLTRNNQEYAYIMRSNDVGKRKIKFATEADANSLDEIYFRTNSAIFSYLSGSGDSFAGVDANGTLKRMDLNLAAYQLTSNLSSDLTPSATKYPSVNAVNTALNGLVKVGGNATTSALNVGTTTAQDVSIIRNGVTQGTYGVNGYSTNFPLTVANGAYPISISNGVIQIGSASDNIKIVRSELVNNNAVITLPQATGQLATVTDLPRGFRTGSTGDGVKTVFNIPHNLTGVSSSSIFSIVATTSQAAGFSYATIDETNVNVYYNVAPPTTGGAGNLGFSIIIK